VHCSRWLSRDHRTSIERARAAKLSPNVGASRILIIEDDEGVRDALSEAISSAGLPVEVAQDGVDGLERLRAGKLPAAILLDLRMPRLGGEEFLRVLRNDPQFDQVPVITMSGGDALGGGDVLAHLRKPFDLDDLLRIVVSLCDRGEA
jgi:CheY-like chemotaxis protein